ncbi:MAG: GNAT family N-acetyltransferase, partial [Verrucomicrobiota bacterium]
MKAPVPAVLTTQRTILRPPQSSDLPALHLVLGNQNVAYYLPHAAWEGPEDGENWLAKADSRQALGTCMTYVIVLKESDLAVGFVVLFDFEENRTFGRIGYALGETYWGLGLVSEALESLLHHAFIGLGMQRLEAEIDPANNRSAGVLAKLGFQK